MHIDRRSFLRAGGLVTLAGIAAACSKGGGNGGVAVESGTIDELVGGREQTLGILMGAPALAEVLARPDERIAALLFAAKGTPNDNAYTGGTARLWLAKTRTEKAIGPFEMEWHDEGIPDDARLPGYYTARVSLTEEGQWLGLVEAKPEGTDETFLGGTSLVIGRQSKMPIPGEAAPVVATPTLASNEQGVDPICTRQPRCDMHDVSLDELLKAGKPAVVHISTPAFCQSAICGPMIEAVNSVAVEMKDEVPFIHIEVYADDKDAPSKGADGLSPAAAEWKLDVEPITFYIDGSGTVVDRHISVMAADEVRASAKALLG